MTDVVTIDAGTLTASVQDRVVTGLLLPYGEQCRSNLGTFSVDPGTFTMPEDVPGILGLNVEHVREQPVGRGMTLLDTPQGVVLQAQAPFSGSQRHQDQGRQGCGRPYLWRCPGGHPSLPFSHPAGFSARHP